MGVTKHAKKRIHQRMGINRKSAEKISKRALREGFEVREFKGSFRRYLDSKFLQQKNVKIKIYLENVFLFSLDGWLVTVFPVPSKYKRYLRKVNDKSKKES